MLLNEARKIFSGNDAVELLNNGKLAGMIGGRKFIPQWVTDDPEHFKSLVDAVLILLGDGQNVAADEVIKYLLKCSFDNPSIWESAISKTPDALINLSTAFLSKWIKEPKWVEKLDKLSVAEKFNEKAWHNLEKDIQDQLEKIGVKRGKKINTSSNSLFDTLYDDGEWKLFRPKTFEGDIELASHIKPFHKNTKARWCTAASKSYWNRYKEDGNGYYVIQHWIDGVYTDAWQIAFNGSTHVEFMDKNDDPNYYDMLNEAPYEMLKLVVCDHPTSMFKGLNIMQLAKAMDKTTRKNWRTFDLKEMAERPWIIMPENYTNIEGIIVTKATGAAVAWDGTKSKITIPASVKNFAPFFFERTPVTEVVFEDGIEELSASTFERASIEMVVLPNTLKVIKSKAFRNCKKLKDVIIPASVEVIEDEAFHKAGLETIKIEGDNLQNIGEFVFRKCPLTSIDIPASVKSIGDGAFESCEELQQINIPNIDKVNIADEAFIGCCSLQTKEILDRFEID